MHCIESYVERAQNFLSKIQTQVITTLIPGGNRAYISCYSNDISKRIGFVVSVRTKPSIILMIHEHLGYWN